MNQDQAVRSKPSWGRRIGYLAAAAALGVAAHHVFDEIAYARMESSALRVQAQVVRVETIRVPGRRPQHAVHYEIVLHGRPRRFSDAHGTSKLRELYVASDDVFEGPDPKIAKGKLVALLVNPSDVNDHRADRAQLPHPWLLWLDKLLSVLLLSAISAIAFWCGRAFRPR